MKGTITSGTGTAARFADRRPAAGKTGTTADYGDAWFVGYTRQLSTAVWMGSPLGNTITMRNVGGRRVTGGSYPARIWQGFMGPAHAGVPILDWAQPAAVGPGTALRVPGEKVPVRRRRTSVAPPPLPTDTTPVTTTVTTSPPPVTEPSPNGQTVGGA
jgi:penicillin-binding protein 1A